MIARWVRAALIELTESQGHDVEVVYDLTRDSLVGFRWFGVSFRWYCGVGGLVVGH